MKATRKANWPRTVSVGNVRVRVYRTQANGYTSHQVANYTSGRRRLESIADEREAMKRAEQIARQLSSGESEAARMRAPETASYGRAVELIRETGIPLEVAAGHFAQAVKLLGADMVVEAAKFFAVRHRKVTARRVSEVVTELLAVKESRKASARYLSDLRSRLGRFADAFQTDAGSVTTADVQAWLDRQKLAAQSYTNFRRVLSLLFGFAVARGYAVDNPIEGLERVKVRGGDVLIFTPSELAKLLSAASPDFVPCLAIGAFAGLRSAEIERLRFQDIDLEGGWITVGADRAKTASRRVVPILPNLAAWIRPYAGRKGNVWTGGHDAFYDAQQETAEKAGLEWRANALRHSFASYRFAEIGDAGRVAGELGNSAAVVHRHYRELVKAGDARKWFSVAPETPENVTRLAMAEGRAQ